MNSVPANQHGIHDDRHLPERGILPIDRYLLLADDCRPRLNPAERAALRIDRAGLITRGIGATIANQVAATPPVGSLFAAFLGHNPVETILGLTGRLNSLSW